MNIGVFFGSFNPIHLGHSGIAERLLMESSIDEIWLSVSPHNPLKEKSDLLPTSYRVEMARLACAGNSHIKVLDFEKDLPQPSFTYEALLALEQRFPQHHFILLIGGDNCGLFDLWRNYDKILNQFEVWAYPRAKADLKPELANRMHIINAPLLNFASTTIREEILCGVKPEGVSSEVWNYIMKNKLYRK